MTTHNLTQRIVSILVLFTLGASAIQPVANVAAQGTDGIHRDYNAQTGKVSHITVDASQSIARMAGNLTAQQRSDGIVQRFAPEFGLTDPSKELTLAKTDQPAPDRVVSKYQQVYQSVPVIAGELVVNADNTGALQSMNGEVSQGLSLDTTPSITVETAIGIARQGMVKWYGGNIPDYKQTQASLWIFDEKLLRPSVRPAELVWKIEMAPVQQGKPIRELVLVNAKTGNVPLHFNQSDTEWTSVKAQPVQAVQDINPTPTPVPTDTPVVTATLIPTDTPITNDTTSSNSSSDGIIIPAAVKTWYVATTGNDANSCSSAGSPCLSINGAIAKAADGDTIKVAIGTYTSSGTEVVLINKSITLSGGWNAGFTAQNGMSTIGGQAARRGLTVNSLITATIERFTIQNGSKPYDGGGGILNSGNLTINLSTVKDNTAGSDGAGILNTGTLTLNNSSVIGNTGEYEGGIANGSISISSPVKVFINNSTISNNTGRDGSGIGNGPSGTIYLNNATVSENTSPGGGYFGGINNKGGGQVILRNTILAGNTQEGLASDCYGTITSAGYNLIGSDSNCTFSATTGDLIGHNNNPINPRLAPLQNNGGITFTQALMVGSPAIDAGNPTAPGSSADACLATDQRNTTRPVNTRCDIGAYEGSVSWTPSPLVSTFLANSNSVVDLPGLFLCNQTQPNCTNNADPQADAAHKYAIGTYKLYANQYLRDSIDDKGMMIISSVHFSSGYDNAFWDGTQMVYGDAYGYPLADDIVAHELTHGVTQYESNLFYFYQSGAINESISDVFGEYYDQTDGLGNDTPAVKWLLGEDVAGLGAIRSMSNPPAFGDPDRMTSSLYDFDPNLADSGGVHSNSGINNKAVYLMVNGGTFNGKTVTGIGWNKTAALYYEANTNLLTSGSDYSDLYYAFQQACVNLTGQKGITSANCLQVKSALDAVEMNSQPVANFNPDTSICPVGMFATPSAFLFQDNMESGVDNWDLTGSPTIAWSVSDFYASSPFHMMWGDDTATSNESILAMKNGVTLPPDSSAFLFFKHAFAFEFDSSHYYDGGVLEYTKDNGVHWLDIVPLFSSGQGYTGIINNESLSTNVLKGRSGFVGDSHGYVSSRYNLTPLAGQTIKFRWRFATDQFASYWGWFVDDVSIYKCAGAPPPIPALQAPANNALTTDYTPLLNWSDVTTAFDHYQVQVDDNSDFSSPAIDVNNLLTSQYQIPSELNHNTTYFWRVSSFNALNASNGWSAVFKFRTALTPPTLVTPNDGDHQLTLRPTFTWTNPNGAPPPTSYTIQISNNIAFTSLATSGTSTTTSFTPTVSLPVKKTLYWRVRANGLNGPSSWSDVRSFSTPNPPSVPVLVAPATNAVVTDYTPLLNWNNSTLPLPVGSTTFDHYQIQVDDTSDFSSTVIDANTTGDITNSDFTPLANLTPNTKYYWHVRAINTSGEQSLWSTSFTFRTALTPPTGLTVIDGDKSLRPKFDWDDVAMSGVSGYNIQVSISPVFASVGVNANVVSSEYTPTTNLPINKTLYWRVRTLGTNGPSDWVSGPSFVSANPPSVPVLVAPANGSLTTNFKPLLNWNNSTLPLPVGSTTFDHYQIQVADNTNFTAPVIDTTTPIGEITKSDFTPLSDLASGTRYYWHVRAFNSDAEYSLWSATFNFRTAYLAPTSLTPSGAVTGLKPAFDWADVNGATGYNIQVSKNSIFTLLVVNANTVSSTYTPTVNLPAMTLYWRVRATGPSGPGPWPPTITIMVTP